MDEKAILNYPGSKKRLLDFIYNNTLKYIEKNKYILDIFTGTGCVAEMYKNNGFKVYANDVENYAYNISRTLLKKTHRINLKKIKANYKKNKEEICLVYNSMLEDEDLFLSNKDLSIINFNNNLPKIWKNGFKIIINNIEIKTINELNNNINNIPFCLFTLYYSGIYFGLKQSIQIDSIRYAIEQEKEDDRSVLFTCLYYAMKEASFSKDGHMAQPLSQEKNIKKLFEVRSKDIYNLFINKLNDFIDKEDETEEGEAFNSQFTDLLKNEKIINNVGFIYADPPYTDMQYSRYFHLLTTVTNYIYPNMTYKNGELTTGLYANNRYQSNISSRSKSLEELTELIEFASKNNITLCFSYAYPIDIKKQATNRYTMNIQDLIDKMNEYFPEVKIFKENYAHCNNRNSNQKKVYEYLILGYVPKQKRKTNNNQNNQIDKLREGLNNITATNKSPLYNNILYWSQKPYNVTDLILDLFTNDGNVVMDPFMGSGVTLIESLNKKYNLKSVGVDINDVPIFLCKTSLDRPSDSAIIELNNLVEKIKALNNNYYTNCPICNNNKAVIKKIIYDTKPELKINDIIYNCSCNSKDLHKNPDEYDIDEFMKERIIKSIKNISLIENSRIAVKSNEKISDKFSNRSFYILDQIKQIIEEEKCSENYNIFKYIYTSIIHKSKILDVKMSSQWPLWVPVKHCIERNVVSLFCNSVDSYIKSYKHINDNYYLNGFVSNFNDLKNNKSLIIKKGIQYIEPNQLPDESVDLIITDPPYLGQVPYSEYMQLYQAFLENDIDYDSEIVITNAKNRKKDYDDYINLMNDAFKNISRMLKKDAYMFLYFHDSSLTVWNDLIKIFNKNNLIFQTSIHITKNRKTLKKILDPKRTMNGESLLIFKKEKFKPSQLQLNSSYIDDIKNICEQLLKNKDSISTSELYDNGILEYIIRNNLLPEISSKFKDLTEIFNDILKWNSEIGMWQLKTK